MKSLFKRFIKNPPLETTDFNEEILRNMANENQNRQAQIRQGLVQYIGAIMNNSDFSPRENKQLAVAALCEEALNLIISCEEEKFKNDKFYIDDYAVKPFLRGILFLVDRIFERASFYVPKEVPKLKKEFEEYNEKINVIKNFFKIWLESEDKK